jgi:hypothetical protein
MWLNCPLIHKRSENDVRHSTQYLLLYLLEGTTSYEIVLFTYRFCTV